MKLDFESALAFVKQNYAFLKDSSAEDKLVIACVVGVYFASLTLPAWWSLGFYTIGYIAVMTFFHHREKERHRHREAMRDKDLRQLDLELAASRRALAARIDHPGLSKVGQASIIRNDADRVAKVPGRPYLRTGKKLRLPSRVQPGTSEPSQGSN